MTEREKMLAGLAYNPGDPDLRDGRARAVGLTSSLAIGEAVAAALTRA